MDDCHGTAVGSGPRQERKTAQHGTSATRLTGTRVLRSGHVGEPCALYGEWGVSTRKQTVERRNGHTIHPPTHASVQPHKSKHRRSPDRGAANPLSLTHTSSLPPPHHPPFHQPTTHSSSESSASSPFALSTPRSHTHAAPTPHSVHRPNPQPPDHPPSVPPAPRSPSPTPSPSRSGRQLAPIPPALQATNEAIVEPPVTVYTVGDIPMKDREQCIAW